MTTALAERYGVITEAGSIVFERLLPGPIERVWEYLTDSEKRGKWLASGPMELRVGGKVDLQFRNSDLSPVKEPMPESFKDQQCIKVHCVVTACEKPHHLSMLWGEGSEVTFELKARGGEVLLTLTHRKLADRAAMLNVAGGWHTHLGILIDHLAGRPARPFWSTHAALKLEYERMIRTE